MRKIIYLFFIYLCFITALKAQSPRISFLNFEQRKLLQTFVNNSGVSITYFVLLNMNDCINCNLPFKLMLNSKKISAENCLLVISNLNKSKITAFRKEYSIHDSLRITTDSSLINTLYSILPENLNNAVFGFKNHYVVKSLPIKFANEDKLFNELDLKEIKIESSNGLKEDDIFYNRIEDVTTFNNKVLAVVGPKAGVFGFDTNFTVKNTFSFNDTFLIKKAYNSIINHFHDSIKLNANNSIDSIIRFYNIDIKPLGLSALKLNAIYPYKDDLYISGSISIPVTTGYDKITFAPGLFVFVFDQQLILKSISEYQLDIDSISGPVDFYGFKVKHHDTLLINVQNFKQNKFKQNFVGKWVKINNYYKYIGLEEGISLLENKITQEYFKEVKQLIFKFSYVNDTIIAFHYLPYILNLRNASVIQIVNSDCRLGYLAYNLKNVEKVFINNNWHYILVEKVFDRTYISIADLQFKRDNIFTMPSNSHDVESFFVLNNKLQFIALTDEGTIINSLKIP